MRGIRNDGYKRHRNPETNKRQEQRLLLQQLLGKNMAHFTGFLSHQFEAPELYGCVTQNRTEMRGLELKGVKNGIKRNPGGDRLAGDR